MISKSYETPIEEFGLAWQNHRIVISHHKLISPSDFKKYPFACVVLDSEDNRIAKRLGIYNPKTKKVKWVDILEKVDR